MTCFTCSRPRSAPCIWCVMLQVDENIACLFAILVGCRILLWVMLKVVAKTRWVSLTAVQLALVTGW